MSTVSRYGNWAVAPQAEPAVQGQGASSNQKLYIVKRDFGDGPHRNERFVTTDKPYAGETIYHGSFQKREQTEYYGPYDAYSRTVTHWVPTGEVTTSKYTQGADVQRF